jgi:hypothetical protein
VPPRPLFCLRTMNVNSTSMEDLNVRECENPVCRTLVGGSDPFCSDYCRNVKFDVIPERVPCRCGHTCCGGSKEPEFGCKSD